jgi:hypothetical protein
VPAFFSPTDCNNTTAQHELNDDGVDTIFQAEMAQISKGKPPRYYLASGKSVATNNKQKLDELALLSRFE